MTDVGRREAIVTHLRERGARITPQRMAILDALLAQDHPTVEEIYDIVQRAFPMISLVTVYRTLALLTEMGQVLVVTHADTVAHYDGHRVQEHPHIVCTSCGRVTDCPDVDITSAVREVGRRADGWSLSHRVHFLGVCPACRETQKFEGR